MHDCLIFIPEMLSMSTNQSIKQKEYLIMPTLALELEQFELWCMYNDTFNDNFQQRLQQFWDAYHIEVMQ